MDRLWRVPFDQEKVVMRVCGACRLCCKVFPVVATEKPGNEWCKFACDSGCAIHEQGIPDVCREYTCYWLEHDEMPDDLRPDRIGIVVTESGTVTVGEETMTVLLFNQSYQEAHTRRKSQTLIEQVKALGMVVMLLYDEQMQLVYDRTRYASISPRDIEVAYRYEQSQDAEELKRLKAVPDDFRPLTREEAEALTPKE
jgi:hypothetical protein